MLFLCHNIFLSKIMSIKRKIYITIWITYILAILYLSFANFSSYDNSISIEIPYVDKVVHFMMYFFLSMLGMIYLYRTKTTIKKKIWYFLFVIFLGIIIEFFQPFFERGFEVLDMVADIIGAVTAWIIISYFLGNNKNKLEKKF